MRVAGAITPVVQAAARYELLDFVSREPGAGGDLPGPVRPRGRRGELPMAASAGAPGRPVPAAFPPIPLRRRLYGFGSIYGKTIRDSRLAFIIAAGLLGGMSLVMGVAVANIFPTPAATAGGERPLRQHPVLDGEPLRQRQPDWHQGRDPGRIRHLQVRRDLRPRGGAVVDLRPVLDARQRGASRQPRLRRRRPVRQAPHRAREADRAPHAARPRDGHPRHRR